MTTTTAIGFVSKFGFPLSLGRSSHQIVDLRSSALTADNGKSSKLTASCAVTASLPTTGSENSKPQIASFNEVLLTRLFNFVCWSRFLFFLFLFCFDFYLFAV